MIPIATVTAPEGNCKHGKPLWAVCIECGRLIGGVCMATNEPAYAPCVGCGACCKKVPCVFGLPMSESNHQCQFLELVPGDGFPRYACGKYDDIINQPGADISPAFNAGCCRSLFNPEREAILRELRNHPDPATAATRHHRVHH